MVTPHFKEKVIVGDIMTLAGVVGADLHPLGATCVNRNLKMCFLTNYTLMCYSYTLQIRNGMILFGSPKCYQCYAYCTSIT